MFLERSKLYSFCHQATNLTIYKTFRQAGKFTQAYSEPCEISKMDSFKKIVNDFQPLTIFARHSVLDASQGSECIFVLLIFFQVKTTCDASSSTISKVSQLMQEAQAKSSKSEDSINKFAKFYTPVVLLVSLFMFIVPLIINKVDEVRRKNWKTRKHHHKQRRVKDLVKRL